MFSLPCLAWMWGGWVFPIERACVWFFGHNSRPSGCHVLGLLRVYPTIPGTNTCCCSCWVSNWNRYSAETWDMFRSPCRMCWHVPYKRPNLQLKWCFIGPCWQFYKLSACFHLCNLWKDDLNADNLHLKFPHVLIKKTSEKSVLLPWYCHWKPFLAFNVFLMQFCWVWSKT